LAPHIKSHRAPCSCFPKKVSLQLSSKQSIGLRSWTGREFHRRTRLQNFCRRNCWVFAAPFKSKRQLTAGSVECCRTRDGSRRPTRQQGCSPKKEVGGRLKQDLNKDFLNNLCLHTRILIHFRKIATTDLWSCPAIQLLVFECL